MFCPKCGKDIPDSSKFCSFCGETINVEAHFVAKVPKATKVPKTPKPPKIKKPKKPRSTKLAMPIISLVLCFLLLLGSTAYFILSTVFADGGDDGEGEIITGSAKSELHYDIDSIEKKQPDIKALDKLVGTDEQAQLYLDDAQSFEGAMHDIENALSADYSEINADNLDSYLRELKPTLNELEDNGLITDFESCDTGYLVTLSSGAYYYYAPEISDADGGDGDAPELYVATYQPCLDTYEGKSSWQYMGYIDDGAASAVGVLISFTVMLIRIRRRKALR